MTHQMTNARGRVTHPDDLLTQISPIFESIGKQNLLMVEPAPAMREQPPLSRVKIQQVR